ncbi:MAG: DUF434 domain-containing protein [Ignisphaera sp.]|uniref:DUF434 domain-containing protein n=1 Tax=Ignisphaera aggregans TaxID=334771 RepID=A0A7J3MZ53_9CREN
METPSKFDKEIYEAAYDYRYLLTKRYPVKASLNIVTARYTLSSKDRLLLYRCVHSEHYVAEINKKFFCKKLNGFKLIVDFYNVLISSINMLQKGEVYLCDDCVPRDLRGSKLRVEDSKYIEKAMKIIANIILDLKPNAIILVADKNISFSLNHVLRFIEILGYGNIPSSYELTSTPDKRIIEYSREERSVIATTDSVIMMQSSLIFPLTYIIMYILKISPAYNFASLFNSACSVCYKDLVHDIDEYCE